MSNKKSDSFKERFSSWENCYKNSKVENLPWYEKDLDRDLKNEITSKNLSVGNFLDLGTGPATQALQLAKYDFVITATDISPTAIENAKKLSNKIHFLVDDLLNSKLPDKKFDFIFDRGIFHVFDISQRPQYVKQIKRILKDDGFLFLKCMSINEKILPDDDMPHKLSKQEIIDTFNVDLDIEKIENTVFHGTLATPPKAWFVVLRNKVN